MREREQKWRQKTKDQGRKQIACWLDGETHQSLQILIQENNLRGIADAMRLLVASHQAVQEPPQLAQTLEVNQDKPSTLDATTQPRQDVPAIIDRQPDTKRCECRTSAGGRCRNKTAEIVKARVDGGIGEFGSCKRHVLYFEPWSG